MLQVSGNALQQLKKFKYLGLVFRGHGRRSEEVDTQISKVTLVLRELYRPVVTKQELSKLRKAVSFEAGLCYDPHVWS